MQKTLERNEMLSSLKSMISERIGSPMYGTFIIAWCVTNWKAIYTTLFVGQTEIIEKTELLKIEYIENLYPYGSLGEIACSISPLIIIPAGSCKSPAHG